MYFKKCIEDLGNKKIKIFVDMDGVIADYVVGVPYDYDKKRPLISNINNLEEVSKMDNVEMYILSISRMNIGVSEKNEWLDKNAPFFKSQNRAIISREQNDFVSAIELKSNYIKNLERDGSCIVVIDDDGGILKSIKSQNDDVIVYKDTILVD